jgi:hypothetical protein
MNSFTVFLIFVNSVQCANILGVFISSLFTHEIVYHSLCRELSLRGHQITGMGRFAAAVSPRPFPRQPFRHGDGSPRSFRRHLNFITAVTIDSIFTEYVTHISRNLNFILDH